MASRRVLVVDDEPEVTFALEAFFMDKGYKMMTALDGLQAMRLLRQHPVDLVLLDMKMPGVNGVEVLKYIRGNCPDTRVVVVTAYDVQFQELVERLGVEGFLIKPFGIQALTRTIEEALAGRKARGVIGVTEEGMPVPTDRVPAARLLFLEPSDFTYKLKEVFFADPDRCGGRYQVAGAYSAEEALAQLETFRPDILLVDVTMLGASSDLALKAMNSKARPKELVIHGSGSVLTTSQGNRVEGLTRLGIKFIQNESFTRAGLLRLNEVVSRTAVEHGLLQEKEARGAS